MKPGVFITFDVECGMGGAFGDPALRPVPPARAVWGQYGGREMGLPLITDILRRHGLAATFFVEVFSDEQGYPGEAARACRYLIDRGQDVQLHVHPCYRFYADHVRKLPYLPTDEMSDLPAELQRELLAEGCRRLRDWTGVAPVAFRAGNMAMSEKDLANLSAVGLHIDSSYTFPYTGRQCRFSTDSPYNGSRWYGDVLEVALSGFRQAKLPGFAPAKPLNLTGISFGECRRAAESICRAGADAVLILHSFSLLKVRNRQYDGGRLDRVVAGRFQRLCEWLGRARDELPTYTFTQLHQAVAEKRYEARAVPPCTVPATMSLARKAVQVYNHFHWT
jgi:hypothetical protein